MTSIESRLAAVERQLRIYRAMTAALLVALVALVGYGAMDGVADVVRARSFEVVNEQGRAVVTLTSVPGLGSGKVELYTAEGQRTVAITALLAGGNVCTIIFDSNQPLAQHACLSGSQITLTSRNTNDPQHKLQPAVTLDVSNGAGRITTFNAQGRPVVSAGAMGESGDGGGTVMVYGPRQESAATLTANFVSGGLDLRGQFGSNDARQTYIAADGLSIRAEEGGRTVNRLNLVVQGQRGVIEANGAVITR